MGLDWRQWQSDRENCVIRRFTICVFTKSYQSNQMVWTFNFRGRREKRAYSVLVIQPEGRKSLVRRRCRWELSITLGNLVVQWEGLDYIPLVENRGQCWAPMTRILTFWIS